MSVFYVLHLYYLARSHEHGMNSIVLLQYYVLFNNKLGLRTCMIIARIEGVSNVKKLLNYFLITIKITEKQFGQSEQ